MDRIGPIIGLWGLYKGQLLQFVKFICIYYLSVASTSNTVCSTSYLIVN